MPSSKPSSKAPTGGVKALIVAYALIAIGFFTTLVAPRLVGAVGLAPVVGFVGVFLATFVLTGVVRKRRSRRKALRSWRAVIALAPGAPAVPTEGFELWLPDRLQEKREGEEQVVFYARRCRWEGGAWKQTDARISQQQLENITMSWPLDTDTVDLAEGWADFVQALVELNTVQSEASAVTEEAEAEPAPQIAELLELPAPVPTLKAETRSTAAAANVEVPAKPQNPAVAEARGPARPTMKRSIARR